MDITGVGWAGILLGYAATLLFVRQDKSLARLTLIFALATTQLLSGFYYYLWAQTNVTDATMYFNDPLDMYGEGFQLNTGFVIWLVQSLKSLFGGTYLDYFLLFQASGTWAAAYLILTFDDVNARLGLPPKWPVYVLLFLPSLHFFTAAIGKDGPLFLAAAMTCWAALEIRSRWITFGVGLAIMVLFRPHIALIAVAAFAISIVFEPRAKLLTRIALTTLGVLGLLVAVATVRSTFQVDVTSADSLADFMTVQSDMGRNFEGGSTVAYDSFFQRMISLLFRPLFFDTEEAFGLIVSFENLVMLMIFGMLIFRGISLMTMFRQVFLIRYAFLFAVMLILMLSAVYYNVGLGLRQRTMVLPALMTLFVAVLGVHRLRTRASPARSQVA